MTSLLRKAGAVLLAITISELMAAAQPQPLPPNFHAETFIASGLTAPTAMEFLPDGSMLITEFTGKILIVPPGASEVSPTPVLQLTNLFEDTVNLGGERGLVGIVADPNFATNRFIYVFYTANNPQRDRVSRFTMNGNVADPASEVVIWQAVSNSISTDHHGGALGFGPDGKLYISTGDNSDPPSCQNLSSDHGKILRVNPNGTIPSDNPFHDGSGPNIDAIWARGLRNPYRFHFDTLTGRLYIGDVGQNTTEEINLGAAGANYGWPICEGTCSTTGMTNPIFTYPHNGRDAAVTAGFIYRGTQFPSQYQGVFFYADYAQNTISYLTLDGNGLPTGNTYFFPNTGILDGPYGNPVFLRQGPDGALYFVDIGVGWLGSDNSPPAIRRIRYTPENQPPIVVSAANPTSGLPPLTVNFSSVGTSDPEGNTLSYSWTFGDGSTSTQANPTHLYQQAGPKTARLSVSDGTNTTLGTPILIQVGRPPSAVISSPISGSSFQAGDVITFSATASDPDDGPLPLSAFSWVIVFHHDTHTHPAAGPINGTASGTFTIPNTGHDFSGNTWYEIILTVTDSTGLSAVATKAIYPEKVNVSFNSLPTNLTLTIDGIPYVTPFTKDTLVKFRHTIAAPNQVVQGTQYNFSSWSDSGSQTHTYDVLAVPQPVVASYVAAGSSSLVAGLSLDEGSGSIANDQSGFNHNGTLVNSPTWTSGGKYGGGLVLNGSGKYVRIDNPGLPTGNFTWMLWVNPGNLAAFQTLLEAQGSTSAELELNVENGKISLWSSGSARLVTNGSIPVNTWTHVALTRSGSILRVFINGVADAQTGSDSRVFSFGSCPFLIGVDADSGCTGLLNGYLNGIIDEVRVYSTALSQSEIQSAMNTPLVPVADTTPPVRSNGQPTGTLPAGTTQATLSLTTNENATCRYATSAGAAYGSMANTFAITGGTAHSTTVTGLINGSSYNFYVRCQDTNGNANTSDFTISFSVAQPAADTTPPVRSNGQPTGSLAAGTTQATLSLATNENAICRYATSAGVAYGSMSNTFSTTGATAHSTTVTGLTNGGSYNFYVRCQDTAGNANTSDFPISFGVAQPGPVSGLVAAYGFNEGTGTSVGDSSGNGLNGGISGASWITQGKFGKALSFDGVNDWVTVAAAPALNLTTGMTLEAWIYPTVTNGTRDILIKEGTNVDIYNLYARNWRGRPEVNVLVGGTNHVAERGSALAANVWTHVAGTYDGAVLRLYINGVQAVSTNIAGTITTSTGALRIGGNSLWGEYFRGRIDEIRIYNRALIQAEIQADMNTPISP